ncbi:beta strand repeat-containing protein [Luteolibacter marinus]|uniref:beta strand repeat-containing protein n=1 Tax=Luteolibacter marinus TaxID=2776705 RepID=UPI001865F265|nr:autotransporter-associated beta strand repeat-containing protein [Luteolibacter marinus]
MTKTPLLASGALLAGSTLAFAAAAPYAWTGAAADGDFFNEANWTASGSPIVDDIFTTTDGMLGGAGSYVIDSQDFSATGAGEIAGGVLWDAGANISFANTNGRFLGIFRSRATTMLTFDNSDLVINGIAEWNIAGDFTSPVGAFAPQWTASLSNGSDIVSSSNGTTPNGGVWFGDLTISDTSTLAVQSLSSTQVTLQGAGSQLTLNGGGNPINNSIVDLVAVGSSVHFLAESVSTVLAEHLFGNSSDQRQSGMLIGGGLIGFPGILAVDLDGSGAYTGDNGASFTLVSDGGAGSILTVTALPSAPAPRTLTYTNSSGDAFWDVNFADDWDNGGVADFYHNGDHVIFDGSANGLPGTLSIDFDEQNGVIFPGSVTVDNPAGNDYAFTGELYGNGPLVKSGSGTLTLDAPDNDMPYAGEISVDGGVLELAGGFNSSLRYAPVTVNPGATFRYASGNAGNSTYTPFTLAGGTLETTNNYLYIWPAAATIVLAPGTDSTVLVSNVLRTNGATISGGGNLIKDGSGTLMVWDTHATYTGSTTVRDGLLTIKENTTSASDHWLIEGGVMRLVGDSAAPIGNLPDASIIEMTGGEFDVTGNVETIGTLSMDSTTSSTTLALANQGAGTTPALLTVDTLDLTGTANLVAFDVAPGFGTFEIMNATTVNGVLGTNLLVAGVPASSQSWSFTGGVISVTIAYTPNAITYTNQSGSATWSLAADTDWSDGSAIGYFDTDNVTFGDGASGLPGSLSVAIANPVTPGSVTFSNTTGNDYTFTGSAITGPAGLAKNGGGSVTLSQKNTFTGDTVINAGTLVLDADTRTLADESEITVNAGATLQLNRTNALQRDFADAGITIDGGTLEFTESGVTGVNTHAHLPALTLLDGALVTGTSGGGFAEVNSDLDGDITVGGSVPSTIGPFNRGIRFASYGPFIDVADVTSDAAVDLTVDARMRGGLGFTKVGAGTMFIAANPGNNTDYNYTVVSEGCLRIANLSSIPADLTKVSVDDGACFGGIVGDAPNLVEADLLAIAANVTWSAGGDARLLIDTAGQTVDIAATIAGNFKIIATGNGTLNLNGGANVNDILVEGSTTVNAASVGATAISIDGIATTAGTTPGTLKAVISFNADGPVDVYASGDLVTWGAPVATGVSGTSVEVDNLSSTKQFFVLVSAGQTFPLAP